MASDTWAPHHITDNDRGPLVTIIASLMMVYMVFCFLARILTRTTINGPFGSDDWVITAGTAVAIIHSSAKLVEVRDGFGKRLSDLEDQDILNIQKYPTWVGVETSGIGVELLLALLPAYIAWVAALRIFYLRKQNMLDDPFFYGVDPSVCMEIELHYGLIAATIACLKPFVKSFNTGYLGRLEIIPDAFRDTIPLQNYKPPRMSGGRDNPSIGEGGALSIETTSGNIETWGDAEAQKFAKKTGALNLRAESDNELRAHLQLNGYLVQVLNREPPADAYTPEQSAILSAAVNHIPEFGFTTRSLTLGARDAGYLDVSLQLFPDGGEMNLITYWLRSRRGMLRQKTKSGELFGMSEAGEIGGLSVEETVLILILERLKMNEEIIEHWQDALATMSLPFNLAPSISELSALSSDILYLANDHSVDSSWYTKRLSVATVYASADVFMTEDTSPGFSATKEFVERQLSDVNLVRRTLSDAKRYLGFVAG
ncbi:ubiquinone biosynthesis protein COQ9 [Histoplasma capsulatum H143]|uniref:Ubiquinone biosynthesis protein n=1 Tax=Ajellomyces capsulatus (strain H143) TaxID=544712 RepID=C6H6W3_AJECH|nr:ubiquinone biosynthesis protein COQ9 [Histoplasma capsulatum H143]